MFDFGHGVGLDFVVGLEQGIFEGFYVCTAVAFDHDAAQAEEDGAVKLARVEAVFEAAQGGQCQQGGKFVQSVATEFFADNTADEFNRSFNGF